MFKVKNENGEIRGALIVFEGADGSGKSTLSKLFHGALLAQSPDIEHQVFPSKDGEVGRLIRRSFTHDIDLSEETLAWLMVADGNDISEKNVYPALNAGKTVICDRHPLVSGWAYQTEVLSLDELIAIQLRHRFLEPDLVFILDCPPEVAHARMKARAEIHNLVFEKDDDGYRNRLRHRYAGYGSLHENVVLLDATADPTKLLATCLHIAQVTLPGVDADQAVAS